MSRPCTILFRLQNSGTFGDDGFRLSTRVSVDRCGPLGRLRSPGRCNQMKGFSLRTQMADEDTKAELERLESRTAFERAAHRGVSLKVSGGGVSVYGLGRFQTLQRTVDTAAGNGRRHPYVHQRERRQAQSETRIGHVGHGPALAIWRTLSRNAAVQAPGSAPAPLPP